MKPREITFKDVNKKFQSSFQNSVSLAKSKIFCRVTGVDSSLGFPVFPGNQKSGNPTPVTPTPESIKMKITASLFPRLQAMKPLFCGVQTYSPLSLPLSCPAAAVTAAVNIHPRGSSPSPSLKFGQIGCSACLSLAIILFCFCKTKINACKNAHFFQGVLVERLVASVYF